jgi:serine/threonine protein kinase/predicted ATPase
MQTIAPGNILNDRFQIVTSGGQGGMGVIYRAIDLQTNQAAAIKIQTVRGPSVTERFLREANTLESLRHPSIVHYLGSGLTPSGELFIAMEWLEGESLKERLRRGPLSPQEAIALFTPMTAALAFIHSRNVIHRDLKPDNIYLRHRRLDDPVLIDFGVVQLRGREQQLTIPGALLGTPQYMSPEQARSASKSGPTADIFSLGCVLFECLSGRPAFEGIFPTAVLAKILLHELPLLREVCPSAPAWMENLLARMAHKDPAQRPADGAALFRSFQARAEESTHKIILPPKALTRQTRRLVSVVLLGGASKTNWIDPFANTQDRPETEPAAPFHLLAEEALAHQASIELLADGTVACLLWGSSVARDQAIQSARLSLRLRSLASKGPISVATGHAEIEGGSPLGEALDVAVSLLRASEEERTIIIDDATASFLETRFTLSPRSEGHELIAEKEQEAPTRTLLGRPTSFWGREEELTQSLQTIIDSLAASQSRALFVTAPAGVGKSRFCHELQNALQSEGSAELLFAQGDARRALSSHALLADLMRRSSGFSESDETPIKLRRLRARLSRSMPLLSRANAIEMLGELAGLANSTPSIKLRNARQNPLLFGDQIRAALRDWLTAECERRPVVLFVDDLHWCDLPSLRAINSALHALRHHPFVVVGFGRPETLTTFKGLWEEHHRWDLVLSGLSEKACAALVQEALGDTTQAAALIEQSGGNAFFLEELIRASNMTPQQGPSRSALSIVETRLATLPEQARDVMRAASILGDVFWPSGVAALLGVPLSALEETIAQLFREELIRQSATSRFSPEPEYLFRHSLLREASYQLLTDHDLRLGHLMAGQWLLAKGERDPVTLAEHFRLGGDDRLSREWYRFAARQAMEGEDFPRVISLCDRALESGATAEEKGELKSMEAEALIWSGRYPEAGERGLEAMEHLSLGSSSWWSAGGLAAVGFGRSGDNRSLMPLADLFLAHDAQSGASRAQSLAQARAALWLWYSGHYQQARELTTACLSREGDLLTDPAFAAQSIFELRAVSSLHEGFPAAHLDNYQESLRCYEDAGFLRHVSRVMSEIIGAYTLLGEPRTGLQLVERALAIAAQLQMPAVAAFCHHRHGQALLRLHRHQEAISELQNAARIFESARLPLQEGNARSYLAMALLQTNQHQQAEQEAKRAVNAASHIQTTGSLARACLAWVMLATERNEQALTLAHNAYQTLARIGRLGEGDTLVRLAYIESLIANQERSEVPAVLATAKQELLYQASNIPSKEGQQNFLEENIESQQIISLSRSWLH